MKTRLYVTRTVKIACLMLALMISVAFLQQYVLRRLDHNSIRLDGFYLEEPNSLDVVTIGASDIYTSFIPGRAYAKFGFTGYSVASESITSEGLKTALKEVLRTQKPKVILIEANAFLYGKSDNEKNEAHIRKLMDNLPISMNKIDYVTNNVAPEDWAEYYMPIIKYHSIWRDYPSPGLRAVSTLKQDLRGYSYLKGFRTTTTVFKSDTKCLNSKLAKENEAYDLNPELQSKLEELLEFCKEEKLDNVVFVRAPHYVMRQTYDRVKRSNKMAEIVKSYGFDYLNLERQVKEIGIDEATDFYNADHMNIYGAAKFTDYLGKLMQDKYGVGKTEHLTRVQQMRWQKAAESAESLYNYCDYLIKNNKEIKLEEDINTLRDMDRFKK